MAGELAFVTATTNNQSVIVDFASWVLDSTSTGLVLGNVQSVNPPTLAESVYYTVDNGDGTVCVKIAAAASGLTTGSDSFEDLDVAFANYHGGPAAKPVPRRCGGALYLNFYCGVPVRRQMRRRPRLGQRQQRRRLAPGRPWRAPPRR